MSTRKELHFSHNGQRYAVMLDIPERTFKSSTKRAPNNQGVTISAGLYNLTAFREAQRDKSKM